MARDSFYPHPILRTVAKIQKKIVKQGKRNAVSRLFRAKDDKEAIATWNQDLIRILHVFNVRSFDPAWKSLRSFFQTELAINTHVMVADIHRNTLTHREGPCSQNPSVSVAFIDRQNNADRLLDSNQVSGDERNRVHSLTFL